MSRLGMGDNEPIQSKMVSKAVESAQKRVEGNNYDARKQLLEYDDVLRQQREIIYAERRNVFLKVKVCEHAIYKMITETIEKSVNTCIGDDQSTEEWDLTEFKSIY